MPIFKYFTEREHALALVNSGELMLQPLSHFRGREADGVRGDVRDGTLTYAPQGGLALNMEDGRIVTLEGHAFNASANQNDIFVYCTSNQLSAELASRFGRFCVEITTPDVIVRRLIMRAHPSSRFDYEQLVSGKVDYRDLGKAPEVDWALPERLVLIKPQDFSWQDEFRIAVGKRGAMNVERVNLTIQSGSADPVFEKVPAPLFLRIGNLTEFATLHCF